MGARVSKSKCPSCGGVSIRPGATKCPACQAWVQPPRFSKRRLRLSPLGVVGFAVGLCIVGMISGVVAMVTAQGRRSAHPVLPRPGEGVAAPLDSGDSVPSAGSASANVPGETPRAKSVEPAAAEGKFTKTEQVRLDATPADIAFSLDELTLFVLTEDGSLRVHDAATGAEKRRVKLPGRGKTLRVLTSSRLAVLGLPAEVVVIDTAKWEAGSSEADFLKRAAIRDVVDFVAVGEPPRFVAVTGQGGRVIRLSGDLSTIEAEFVSVPAVSSLATLRVGEADRLVLLLPGRPPTESGAVVVCDAAQDTFGLSRSMWSGVTDPRVSNRVGTDKLLLFDAAAASIVDFSFGAERRLGPSGPQPIAAFRWIGDRAVVIGAGGTATFVSLERREVQSTVALGGAASAAVGAADWRAVIVALGGGLRGRGTKTVVLAGEPPAIESTIETGEGSQLLAMASKRGSVAVGAVAGRALTLLVRK